MIASSFFLLVLSACTADAVKRGAYEALYQKRCMDISATPSCDPQHKTYDEYRTSREKALKPDH